MNHWGPITDGDSGGTVRTVYDDIEAFYREHRRCGKLDTGVEGERVWVTCECGAALSRGVPE